MFPAFEELVLERLQKNFASSEISNIKRCFRYWPAIAVLQEDLPAAVLNYGDQLDETSGNDDPVKVQRPFIASIPVIAFGQGVDVADIGAESLERTTKLIQPLRHYFVTNSRLETSTEGPLKYMELMTFRITGPRDIITPGGDHHLGLIMTFNILMKAKTTRVYKGA